MTKGYGYDNSEVNIDDLTKRIAADTAALAALKAVAKPKAEVRIKQIMSDVHALLKEAETLGKEHIIPYTIEFSKKTGAYNLGKQVMFTGFDFVGRGELAPKDTDNSGWQSSSYDC